MARISKRGLFGVCMAAIPIILIFIAIFSHGWYTLAYDDTIVMEDIVITPYETMDYFELDIEMYANMGLSDVKNGIDTETTLRDSSMGDNTESFSDSSTGSHGDACENVSTVTLILLIISLILIFSFIVTGIMASLHYLSGRIPKIVGFVAIFFLIFSVSYYPVFYPRALEKDFEEEIGDSFFFVLPDEMEKEFSAYFDNLVDSGEIGWSYYLTIYALVILLPTPFMFKGIKKVKRPPKGDYIQSRDNRQFGRVYPPDRDGPLPRRDDHYEDRRGEHSYLTSSRKRAQHQRKDDYQFDGNRRRRPPQRQYDHYNERRKRKRPPHRHDHEIDWNE